MPPMLGTWMLASWSAWLTLAAPSEPPRGPDDAHVTHPAVDARTITFDEALTGSAQTPALAGAVEAHQIKRDLDRDIPRLTQGPQLTVMPGARVHPDASRGFEIQATATQSWSLEGYGRSRHATARAQEEQLDAQARAQALERQLAAARAWIELHAAENELTLAEHELSLARSRLERMEAARAGGVATRAHVAEARTDVAELTALRTELAGLVHDLGLVLARETGADARRPLRTTGPYPDPALPDDDELWRRFDEVDRLPAVAAQRLQARALRAQSVENRASRGTRLTTGVSMMREGTSDVVFLGVIGVSLAGDRGQRQRASTAAAARVAEGQADQRALELRATLSTVLHDLHHARERVEILRDEVLPAAAEAERAHETARALGEGTEPELLLARRRRVAVSRRLAAAEGVWVWAKVEAWLYLEAFVAAENDAAREAR